MKKILATLAILAVTTSAFAEEDAYINVNIANKTGSTLSFGSGTDSGSIAPNSMSRTFRIARIGVPGTTKDYNSGITYFTLNGVQAGGISAEGHTKGFDTSCGFNPNGIPLAPVMGKGLYIQYGVSGVENHNECTVDYLVTSLNAK